MAIQELSTEEAMHVAGGLFPLAGPVIGGAVAGGAGYWYGENDPSWQGLAIATGTGAAGGAIGGFIGPMLGLFGNFYALEMDY